MQSWNRDANKRKDYLRIHEGFLPITSLWYNALYTSGLLLNTAILSLLTGIYNLNNIIHYLVFILSIQKCYMYMYNTCK